MLRPRTKFTLVMTSLVLFVVAVLSYAFGAQLLAELIQETDKRAGDLAEQVFVQAKYAPFEALQQNLPRKARFSHGTVEIPDPYVRDYVRYAFEISEGLQAQLKAAKENPLIYEVSITDTDGMVLASSDPNLPGAFLARRASLSQLAGRSFLHQMKVLFVAPKRTARKPQLFEHDYAFINDSKPFWEVRVVVDSALLVQETRVKLLTWGIIALVVLVVSLLAAMLSGIRLLQTAEST